MNTVAETDTQSPLAFFKALADESRLKMLGLMATAERTGEELAERLDLKAPTVSHHLGVLSRLGLVTSRSEGTTRWHALAPQRLTEFSRAFLGATEMEKLAPDEKSFEAKVRAAFIDKDGALSTIPASRRKRAVILAWLAGLFVEGRAYREAEVNDILTRRHWDCATLRRELVGHRMMERSNSVYRRLPEAEWRAA
jgi:DNA-binding transcriptional ArsR family regulator